MTPLWAHLTVIPAVVTTVAVRRTSASRVWLLSQMHILSLTCLYLAHQTHIRTIRLTTPHSRRWVAGVQV